MFISHETGFPGIWRKLKKLAEGGMLAVLQKTRSAEIWNYSSIQHLQKISLMIIFLYLHELPINIKLLYQLVGNVLAKPIVLLIAWIQESNQLPALNAVYILSAKKRGNALPFSICRYKAEQKSTARGKEVWRSLVTGFWLDLLVHFNTYIPLPL